MIRVNDSVEERKFLRTATPLGLGGAQRQIAMDHHGRDNNLSYNCGNVGMGTTTPERRLPLVPKVTVQHLLVLTNTEGTLLTFGLDVLESMHPWIHGLPRND